MVDIYIISGFLGAGKTTLIQKLLEDGFYNKKVALIENDFGEKSIDSCLLKNAGYYVTELNSGCICCTIRGDFEDSICTVIKTYSPDVIIIEPSGVGKLSDIETACTNDKIAHIAEIKKKITVVDSKNCKKFYNNFGEFFDDQIKNTDLIIFSKTNENEQNRDTDVEIIRKINPDVKLLWSHWEKISHNDILQIDSKDNSILNENMQNELMNGNEKAEHIHHEHCHHEHSDHDHCHCHTADEAFQTITIKFSDIVNIEILKSAILSLEDKQSGEVIRVKGIVKSENTFYNVQYVPDELIIDKTEIQENEICIIGRNLKEERIKQFFMFK